MTVYTDIKNIDRDTNSIITVGTFDGLHRGHREILNIVKSRSLEENCRSIVVTFEPHPRIVLDKSDRIKILSSLDEKISLFDKQGIGGLLVLKFDEDFSQQTSEMFFKKYIIEGIGLREIVIGYDHRFGKGRDGDEHTLQTLGSEFGFSCIHVPEVQLHGRTISSSLIRNLLKDGKVSEAADYLGHTYSISGVVVEGNKRGRTLGFPTANINFSNIHKLVPADGVYAVKIEIDGDIKNGIMNIGVRPTFDNNSVHFNEVHLIDFDADIYDKLITVCFIERIRSEKKFQSIDELKFQIKSDKDLAVKILETI